MTHIPTSKRDNAFLVDGDDGLTLVDVGWARAPDVLLGALAELGRKPGDIKRIVLTHAHPTTSREPPNYANAPARGSSSTRRTPPGWQPDAYPPKGAPEPRAG